MVQVLRCVIQITLFFSKPLKPYAVSLYSSCLDLFSRMLPLYVAGVVNPNALEEDGKLSDTKRNICIVCFVGW